MQRRAEEKNHGKSRMRRINTCIAKRNENKKTAFGSRHRRKMQNRFGGWCRSVGDRNIVACGLWSAHCTSLHATHAIESAAKTYCLSFFPYRFLCVCQPLNAIRSVFHLHFFLCCVLVWPFLSSKPMTIMAESDMLHCEGMDREIPKNQEKRRRRLQQHRIEQMLAIYTIKQHPNLAIFADNS